MTPFSSTIVVWWMGKASSTYDAANLAREHRIYGAAPLGWASPYYKTGRAPVQANWSLLFNS